MIKTSLVNKIPLAELLRRCSRKGANIAGVYKCLWWSEVLFFTGEPLSALFNFAIGISLRRGEILMSDSFEPQTVFGVTLYNHVEGMSGSRNHWRPRRLNCSPPMLCETVPFPEANSLAIGLNELSIRKHKTSWHCVAIVAQGFKVARLLFPHGFLPPTPAMYPPLVVRTGITKVEAKLIRKRINSRAFGDWTEDSRVWGILIHQLERGHHGNLG